MLRNKNFLACQSDLLLALVKLLPIISLLALNGCFAIRPDTCEMSACELESKTNKNDIALSTQEPTRIVKPKIVEVCACNSFFE